MPVTWSDLVTQARIGHDPAFAPGAPYDHILTITIRQGVAMVEGLRDDNPRGLLRHLPELRAGLRARGAHTVAWVRMRQGEPHLVRFPTAEPEAMVREELAPTRPEARR